jgi:hypothetical protein
MTATPPPLTDQQLAERIAEVIRPRMLIGLQDAELHDGPGTERINEWATSIANWAAEVVRPEVARLRAERDQFADRVDTLTAVAKSNKQHVQVMYSELQKARAEAFTEAIDRFRSLADLAPDSERAPGLNFAVGALMAMRDRAARTAGES